MAGKIFINYRRGDDAGFTQALFQRLEDEFATQDLFMDVEGHIRPGDDFVEVLNRQVASCDVLLAVIGPRWAELLAARAGDRDDFVAIEIKAALDQGKRVIPVLVGGAGMPRADSLPGPIGALARRNAVGLRPERFKADCQGLITALKEQLAAAEQERAARTEAERAAAEAARREAEAQAAARAKATEERGRAQAAAGLSAEEIRKAEELANWDFIKERRDPQALRDHLARFPGGVTALYAQTKLEELVWAVLGSSPDMAALHAFLEEFPKGANAEAAWGRLAELERAAAEAKAAEERRAQETAEWGAVAASTDEAEIEAFLAGWPGGEHAAAAKVRLKELKGGRFTRRGLIRAFAGGAAATAALGGAAYVTFVPGQPVWRLINDRSLTTLSGGGRALAITPDGQQLVAPGRYISVAGGEVVGGSLKAWELPSGRELRVLSGSSGDFHSLAVTPDGRQLVTAEGWSNGSVKVLELASGRELRTLLRGSGGVRAVAITPDARYVIVALPYSIKVLEFDSGRTVHTLDVYSSYGISTIICIAVTPDSRQLVAGVGDLTIRIWDLERGRELRKLSGHSTDIHSVAVTPDGRHVVSGSWDKTVKVWDLAGGREQRTLSGHWHYVVSVAVMPDGRHVASGSWDCTIRIWELDSGRARRTLSGHLDTVDCLAVTPDGRHLVSGGSDGTIKIWDISDL